MGGVGLGGGVDVEGGLVTISNSQIEHNTAWGGPGGLEWNSQGQPFLYLPCSGAAGGGLYAGAGTIHLTQDIIQSNQAYPRSTLGGIATSGGGIYVVTGTTLTKDSFTSSNLLNNLDSHNDSNDNLGTGGPVG